MEKHIKDGSLLTAEEILSKKFSEVKGSLSILDMQELMIKFAKLHVKAAEKRILDDASLYLNPDTNEFEIDLNSIRNAYPENLIK